MKIKSFCFTVFLLLLVFLLVSCDLSPASEHSANISTDSDSSINIVTISIYDGQERHMLNPHDNEYLIDLFNSHCDDLIHDVYKFSYDYSFMVNDDDRWDYCSDSGAFCNKSKQQSFLIDELEKKEVNLIIEDINAQYTTPNEHHENESTTEPMSTEEPALSSAIAEYTPQQADPIISASPTDDSAKDYLEEQNGSNEEIQPQLSLKSNDIIVKPMSFIYSSETYMEDLKALIHATAAPIDLSSIMVSLPELSIEDEYHILVGANEKLISVSLCSIDAQDPDNIKWITVSEPLNLFKPNDYADILDNNGTIIVQIRIAVSGKTIPEIGQSENYIYSCLFKISRI